jgi:hypothetical protein
MSLRLIIEDDEGSTTVVPLGRETITIGRQEGNTIQLTEKNVSRRHAQLLPEGESWVLEDLGSYNGVKVNGRPASGRVVLQEGDVVQIGDYHLALTEDVDRRTLNYDRPRSAANDGAEPMLASSSTNLPKLSPEALAALSSGQHAAQAPATMVPPSAFVDSGQMPMVGRAPAAAHPEEGKSKVGLILIGLAVLGGVVLGGFWFITRDGGGGKQQGTAVADSGDKAPSKGDAPAKADTKTQDPVPSTPPKLEPISPPTTPDAKVPIEPPPVVDPTGEDPPVVDPPDADPPDVDPTPKPSKPTPTPKPKPDPTPSTPKPTPKPDPTPEPEIDVDALLKEATGLQFKSPSQAYDLAAKVWAAKKHPRAAFLMATTACRMGDTAKAKKAVAKTKGQYHDEAVTLCAEKGITLD